MIQLNLKEGINPQVVNTLIKSLTYQNYRYNRLAHPEVPVEHYRAIFDNVEALEAQYIQEGN